MFHVGELKQEKGRKEKRKRKKRRKRRKEKRRQYKNIKGQGIVLRERKKRQCGNQELSCILQTTDGRKWREKVG